MTSDSSAMALASQLLQSLSVPQTASTNSPQPRLRQACDGCTAAKVKCDKGRPACQRCLDCEDLCQYSPSRRYGKRPRRVRATNQQTTEPSITPPADDLLAWDLLDPTSLSTNMSPSSLSGHELDMSNSLLWSNFDRPDCMSQDDSNSILNMQISSLDRDPTRGDDAMSIDTSSGYDFEQPKNETEHALECEARALAVLRSLQISPALCTPERNKGSSISTPNATKHANIQRLAYSVDSIDTLLATNKAALNELIQLLECRCAENSHVALLHLAILSKIVFWYNVVVTSKYNSEKVELKPMKIQFGVLDLDDDDNATLHQAVLCRELQKAGNAVRAFEVRFASSSMPVSHKEPPWGRIIIRAIREDLERSVNEIERLQTKPF